MRQEFTIPGRLASLNEYISAAHTPWKRIKLKEANEGKVIEAAQGLKPVKTAAIRITYYEGKTSPRQKVRDLDNVSGAGNKFILDALVSMGILPNDDPSTVTELHMRGFKATGEPRITVEIESEE